MKNRLGKVLIKNCDRIRQLKPMVLKGMKI